MPRWSLAALSLVHAGAFAWAAVVVPWRSWTLVSVLATLLALLHLVTAALAALRRPSLPMVWRAQSALALASLAYVGWSLLSSAWIIATTYQGVGRGVTAILLAAFSIVILWTLPLACWGLAASGGVRVSRTGVAAALALTLVLAGQLVWLRSRAEGSTLTDEASMDAVRARVEQLGATVTELQQIPGSRGTRGAVLAATGAASCASGPSPSLLTLVLSFISATDGSTVTRCIQAADATALGDAAARTLSLQAARGPIKIDLLTLEAELPSTELLASLVVRPGLDGVCSTGPGSRKTPARCLMPWQLVAQDLLGSHQPIASVPDVRVGASLPELRALLGAEQGKLTRIATRSWLLDAGGDVSSVERARRDDIEVTSEALRAGADAAERYILNAQYPDGRFRYVLQPHTGEVEDEPFSIARQAGTTLALCALGQGGHATRRAVERSLALLATLAKPVGRSRDRLQILRYPSDTTEPLERIGPSTLSVAALVRCRALVGHQHDALARDLARTVLSLQRSDGAFHHQIDAATGAPVEGRASLYVDGQIVLALAMLEATADDTSSPSNAQLSDAVERAMGYFGGSYWDGFLRPFFFLEENWHCLAAAAALPHHRHDAYERFCLDYIEFKRRLVHELDDGVHPDFVGGYGLGNVVPPHNTATAGFGEALAAAVDIKRARGLDVTRDVELLRSVLSFLLRNQWRAESCYSCRQKHVVAGGFSEHMASPRIRIDYVQHAFAALGQGAASLGVEGTALDP